jgi:hypothetical protein
LILCSHFLLLYSEQLDWEFHLQAVTGLLEYGKELRIFPLLTLRFDRSPYIDPLREYLEKLGYHTKIVPVEYELQPGENEILVINKLLS